MILSFTSQRLPRSSTSGYTLLELMVTIGILSIITMLSTRAFPIVRDQQNLVRAERQLQSLLRTAQQNALDEERTEACLASVSSASSDQRRCSDIGVAIRERELKMFADTIDDNRYTENGDFVLSTSTFASEVISLNSAWRSFLFEGIPPSITLFSDGQVVNPTLPVPVTLQAGQAQASYNLYMFGQLEKQ